jgi:hypothetical protein
MLEVLHWPKNTNRTDKPIVIKIDIDCMQVAKTIIAKLVNRTEFGRHHVSKN